MQAQPDVWPRVGSAAIVIRDGQILLGRRNKDTQRDKWVLPGGRIKPFETIAEAAAREVAEETGLAIDVQDRFGVYEILVPGEHRIVIFSRARVTGDLAIRAGSDISAAGFFSVDESLLLPLTELTRRVLTDLSWGVARDSGASYGQL